MSEIKCITGEPLLGHKDEQKQEQLIAHLRRENEQLKRHILELAAWPEGMRDDPGAIATGEDWRRRCLSAERRLESCYERCRDLNERLSFCMVHVALPDGIK